MKVQRFVNTASFIVQLINQHLQQFKCTAVHGYASIQIINLFTCRNRPMTDLTNEEKMKFSQIMYNSHGTEEQEIEQLSPEEITKLREYYAQKIAFENVNSHLSHSSIDNNANATFASSICCCINPDKYKDKFDIRSSLFFKRCCAAFIFFKNKFLEIGEGRIQLYGALWVSIFYILILSISANLNEYFIQPRNYRFDKKFIVYAIAIVAIFKIAEPFIYAAVVRCLGGVISNVEAFMLTGYSLMLYIIPTLLCAVPSSYWHIVVLGFAGLLRAVFLFRNFGDKIEAKKVTILGTSLIIEAFYTYVIFRSMFGRQYGETFDSGFNRVFHEGVTLRTFHD